MSQSRENLRTDKRKDGRTEGRMNRPYLIAPFRPRPGIQKRRTGMMKNMERWCVQPNTLETVGKICINGT